MSTNTQSQQQTPPRKLRYFLKIYGGTEQEITRDEYQQAERACGFQPKFEGGLATGGFTNGVFEGTVRFE